MIDIVKLFIILKNTNYNKYIYILIIIYNHRAKWKENTLNEEKM